MKRAIVLFPKFDPNGILWEIRKKYDPLADFIESHITVVFPFNSNLSIDRLERDMSEALQGSHQFEIRLQDFTGDFRDGYLFLNVKKGNDPIIALHDRLYNGVLKKFLFRGLTFCPHLTVGRLTNRMEFDRAIDRLSGCQESFETVINTIFVVNIDGTEHAKIEFSIELD